MFKTIQEGSATLKVPAESRITKELPVFYNPVMKLNRDITILLLNSVENKNMEMLDLLAGSGVRSIRFLKELKKGKIKSLDVNDGSKEAYKLIKENLRLNKIKNKNINISNKEGNELLLQSLGYDYIDIDPFGSPNVFLNNAVKRLKNKSIFAVTATDQAPLAGTVPKACKRKYWARPLRNEFMHETALRILIRKVQLVAAQFDRAMIPIFSYANKHHYRIFFRCDMGKTKVDNIITQHKNLIYCWNCLYREVVDFPSNACPNCKSNKMDWAGPLWIGNLCDKDLVNMMSRQAKEELKDFMNTIKEESKSDSVGFYNTNRLNEKHQLGKVPRKPELMEKLDAFPTHLDPAGFKTEKSVSEIIKVLKSL